MGSQAAVVDRPIVAEGADSRDARIAALFDENYGRLRDLAFMIIGDRGAAEELVMEAFLKTFSGWGRIRDLDKADAYLKRAVVNLCRSRIRRKSIEFRQNAVVYKREERRPLDWDADLHEDSRQLWAAVRKLPVRQRACIVLFYAEDLPEGDIAEILDCSVGTVRSQLSRARQKLGAMLEGSGFERRKS